jgi:NADP-dependent 3-hydroxy acid dehydrogenase YdfG
VAGRLEGKIAIVVGAGQTPGETIGNGRAAALLFAREGAKVLCVDRLEERVRTTMAEIEAEGGIAAAFAADISRPEDCVSLVQAALDSWGRVDVLLNNAGIGGGDAPAHRIEEKTWERILSVNLSGMLWTIKAVLPAMRAQQSGAIVNVSSLASIAGGNQIAYEVSKAGVNRLQRPPWHPLQRHRAGVDGHADGGLRHRPGQRPYDRGGAARARRPRAAAREDGFRMGHGLRRPVSGLGRSRVHHRRGPAGGRRHGRAHRLIG